MVGSKYEQDGIVKHGSKMINAVSNAQVPKLTVILGASFGAGNYAMCGRAYDPRFLFAWPNSKVAVMGSEQLVGVMEQVSRDADQRKPKGKKIDEERAKMMQAMFKQKVDGETDPFYVTSRGIDDGIIDPRDTRDVLGICLSVVHNTQIQPGSSWGISRM